MKQTLLVYLGFLYFIQGALAGYFGITLVAQFRSGGATQAEVAAILATGGLAWVLKPVWTIIFAPIIDLCKDQGSIAGRRLILAVLPTLIIICVWTSNWATEVSGSIALWMFVANSLVAVLDLATDGLAVDAMPDSQKELANGVMWSSRYLGLVLGGAGLTWVGQSLDFHLGAGLLCVLLALSSMLPFVMSAGLLTAGGNDRTRVKAKLDIELTNARTTFAHEVIIKHWKTYAICLVVIVPTAYTAQHFMASFAEHELLNPESYAVVKGGAAAVAGALGALLGGITSLTGKARLFLCLGMALQSIVWLFAIITPLSPTGAATILVFDDFSQSAWSTLFFGLLMRRAVGRFSATTFGLMMACVNLSGVLGNWFFMQDPGTLDWQTGILVGAVLQTLLFVTAFGLHGNCRRT